jgi:hypothetical protein
MGSRLVAVALEVQLSRVMRLGMLLGAVLLAGCDLPRPAGGPQACASRTFIESAINDRLDLLLVIDDSPAMAPWLPKLAENAALFMRVLESFPFGVPDLHVAVTTTSARGLRRDLAACGIVDDRPYLATVHGFHNNFSRPLAQTVSCMVTIDATSADPPEPLRSAQVVLEDEDNNGGFRRSEAFLSLLFVSSSDDASPGSVATYLDALLGTGPSRSRVAPAVIAAPNVPRLRALVNAAGDLGRFVTLDEPSWVEALRVLAEETPSDVGRPCIPGPLADPVAPDCTVARLQYAFSPLQHPLGLLAQCDPSGTAEMCWLRIDDADCAPGMGFRVCYDGFDPLDLTRCGRINYGPAGPVDGEVVEIECALSCP